MDNTVDMQSLLAKADPSTPPTAPGPTVPIPVTPPTGSNAAPTAGRSRSVADLIPRVPAQNAGQQVAPPKPSVIGAAVAPPELSWPQKMAQSLLQPANGDKSPGFGPEMIMAALKGIAPPPPQTKIAAAVGGTPWSVARSNADQTQPTTPIQPPQGGWRSKVNDLMAGLGDASQGTPGGGWLTAVTGTLKNRNQRMNEEMKDRAMMAMSNAQMVHEQAMTHQLGEEAIKSSIKEGSAALDNILNPGQGGVPGKQLAKGVTSDQLNQMIQKGTLDPSEDTAFATGRIQTGEDTNGQPIFRTTYTVVKPAGDVQINKENVDMLNKYLHRDYKEGQILPAVQFNHEIQQAFNARTAAQTRDLALIKNDIDIQEMKDSVESREVMSDPQVTQALASVENKEPNGEFDENVYVKAYALLKNSGAFSNPKSSLYGKDAPFRIMAGGSSDPKEAEKNFKIMEDNLAKAQEKTRDAAQGLVGVYEHDQEKALEHPEALAAAAQARMNDKTLSQEDQDKAKQIYSIARNAMAIDASGEFNKAYDRAKAEAKAKSDALVADNPKGLVGQEFIDSLPAPRAALLNNFLAGNVAMTDTMLARPAGIQLATDLYTAFPNGFDKSKAQDYPKLRADFQHGYVSKQISAANTSMMHFGTAYDAVFNGSDPAAAGLIGKTQAFADKNTGGRTLDNAALVLSDEMGKLYSGGVVSDSQQKEWADKLNPYQPGMTVAKLNKNYTDFITFLGGKLETIQDQWDNGVPSKQIAAPMKIAYPQNKALFKKVTGQEMKVHDEQTIQGRSYVDTPPPGTTATTTSADGKTTLYLVNGQWVNLAGQRVK